MEGAGELHENESCILFLLYEMSLGKNMTSNLPPPLIVRESRSNSRAFTPSDVTMFAIVADQLVTDQWSVTSPNILSRHIHNDTGI